MLGSADFLPLLIDVELLSFLFGKIPSPPLSTSLGRTVLEKFNHFVCFKRDYRLKPSDYFVRLFSYDPEPQLGVSEMDFCSGFRSAKSDRTDTYSRTGTGPLLKPFLAYFPKLTQAYSVQAQFLALFGRQMCATARRCNWINNRCEIGTCIVRPFVTHIRGFCGLHFLFWDFSPLRLRKDSSNILNHLYSYTAQLKPALALTTFA